MNRVVFQVPVDYQIRRDAEEGALEQGFSSLQEAVRLFLNQLAKRTVSFTFLQAVPRSSKKEKRYLKNE